MSDPVVTEADGDAAEMLVGATCRHPEEPEQDATECVLCIAEAFAAHRESSQCSCMCHDLDQIVAKAVASEREACATMLTSSADAWRLAADAQDGPVVTWCEKRAEELDRQAAAIRARGQEVKRG